MGSWSTPVDLEAGPRQAGHPGGRAVHFRFTRLVYHCGKTRVILQGFGDLKPPPAPPLPAIPRDGQPLNPVSCLSILATPSPVLKTPDPASVLASRPLLSLSSAGRTVPRSQPLGTLQPPESYLASQPLFCKLLPSFRRPPFIPWPLS